MKRYNVIWFDDQFESLNIICEKAQLNGINLVGFTNAKDGIAELESPNIDKYDAAILDGNFYKLPNQVGNIKDDSALFNVGSKLEGGKFKKLLPWYILSGQMNFTKEINRYASGFDKRVYDKLNDADLDQLWIDLKAGADEQPDAQIRHEFSDAFEVCTEQYIGVSAQKTLLSILKSLKDPTFYIEDELYFTQIRIILETLFRVANKKGLLHDKCIPGGKVNLTESSLFMSGEETKHSEVSCKKVHFPKLISESVKSILFVTGAASHTVDPDIRNNINLDLHRTINNTPYLLYSLTFQLMDILIWFKNYVDENSDIETNKKLWKPEIGYEGNWIPGIVMKIDNNRYGTFQSSAGGKTISIPPKFIDKYLLNLHDKIEITTKPDPSGTKIYIETIRKL